MIAIIKTNGSVFSGTLKEIKAVFAELYHDEGTDYRLTGYDVTIRGEVSDIKFISVDEKNIIITDFKTWEVMKKELEVQLDRT